MSSTANQLQHVACSDVANIQAQKNQAAVLLQTIRNMVDRKETDTLTLEEILNQLGVSNQNYKDAHCPVAKRSNVIFKRDLDECWINPYNKHLLHA